MNYLIGIVTFERIVSFFLICYILLNGVGRFFPPLHYKNIKSTPPRHQDKKQLQGHQIRSPSWFEGFDCAPNSRALNKTTIYTSRLKLISFIHHYEFKWSIVLGILCRASSKILRSFSSKSARSMQSVQIAYRVTLMQPWRMLGFYLMHLQALGLGKDMQWDELTFRL